MPGVTGFGYDYDANRRKLAETNGVVAGETQYFAYDDADRLTALAYSGMVLAASGQMDTGSIGAGRERLERFLKLAPKDHILRKQVEQALSASAPKKV